MTGYIYNGFGQYEVKGKETGITLRHGGVEFWLPYKKVTAIPDYTFREVHHEATAEAWEDGNDEALIYATTRIPGVRIVEELTETQQPIKNREKGIIAIRATKDRFVKDKYLKVCAGVDENGTVLYEEVPVITPTLDEVTQAETLRLEYAKLVIEEYYQSKREHMAGKQGQIVPLGIVKLLMAELNIQDIDQVTIANQKQNAAAPMDPNTAQEYLALLAQALIKGITGDQAIALAKNAASKIDSKKTESALT